MVSGWPVRLAESNAGTLQLTCAGVETFGRLLLGEGSNDGVSKKSFIGFIENYFSVPYQARGLDIYETYRCGLLHSHYLGFDTDKGFFPTRGNKHLHYTNVSATTCSPVKTTSETRLIMNVETFAADFQQAVETYVQDALTGAAKTLKDGSVLDVKRCAEGSLGSIPVDYDFHDALRLQDAAVTGTMTST